MISTDTLQTWIREEYNKYISTYVQSDDCVRMTNGSAAHYVDIYLHGNSFVLEGEHYGDTITTSCDASRDALMDSLSKVF